MATLIPVKITRNIRVATSPETMHELVSDVPRSVSHWPDVQNLVPLEGSDYRWEMVPVSYGGISMQPIYVLRYFHDAARGRVWWEPVKQDGHFVEVEGFWQLAPAEGATDATFELDMRFDLPVPAMLVGMAKQLLGAEIGRQVDTYLAAITKTLEAPA